MNKHPNIRTLVARICAALYSATNSQRQSEIFDTQLVINTLNDSNRLGITSYVKDWYQQSNKYNQSLSEALKNIEINNLLTSGDSYWSSYNLTGDNPTVLDLSNHYFCYKLASECSEAMIESIDDQKIRACLYEAGARCLLEQFTSAFDSFFPTAGSVSSHAIYSDVETKHKCDDTSIQTYIATGTDTGDESATTTAVSTITTGSGKIEWDRKENTRISEPYNNHLNDTSTLHTRLMMSDLSEQILGSQPHARHSNTFDKLQTSAEYVVDIKNIFTSIDKVILDNEINDETNTKLQNQFLYSQVGDRSIVSNPGEVASTRKQ